MCQPWQVTEGSRKAVIAAFFGNLGIAIAKLIGFFVTRSAGMPAESVHSFADTGNQALLFLGGARAKRDATPEHPFGFGRERYFRSFAVAAEVGRPFDVAEANARELVPAARTTHVGRDAERTPVVCVERIVDPGPSVGRGR